MNVDPTLSRYAEAVHEDGEFSRVERKRGQTLLRRLQFLEHKDREDPTGSNPYNEKEIEALEWALVELGFIEDPSE